MNTALFFVAVAFIFAINVFFVGHYFSSPIDDVLYSSSELADFQAPFQRKEVMTTSTQLTSPVSAKYPRVSCRGLLAVNRNVKQNVSDPNGSHLYGRYTVNKSLRTSTDISMPSFWVSLHNKEFDYTRWSLYEKGEYYEMALSAHFVKILTANTTDESPLHVIDVGGNIGYFSLLSVASALQAGRRIIVDTFEPNPRNHRRFCESLHMNQWLDHPDVAVNLYPAGVTAPEKAGTTGIMNIGQSGSQGIGNAKELKGLKSGTWSFPLLSLDELGEELGWYDKEESIMPATTAILKVDIEGLELDALVGSRKLIASGRVQNIFSEGNIRNPSEIRDFEISANQMLESGYKVNKIGGWIGPDEDLQKIKYPRAFDGVQDKLYVQGLVGECAGFRKRKRSQCNIWWLPQNEQSMVP